MALRVLEYTAPLDGDLLCGGRAAPSALPPVLPIVLYNGDAPWRPATERRDLIAVPPTLAAAIGAEADPRRLMEVGVAIARCSTGSALLQEVGSGR